MTGKYWLSVIILIVVGYQVYNGLRDIVRSNQERNQWTEEDRTLLIGKCIKEMGNDGILYPEIARRYCECGNELLLDSLSKFKYLEILKKTVAEQIEITKPIFQECLTTYEKELKAAESEEWTNAEYELIVKKCIQNSKESADKYPAITRSYCECSRKKMLNKFSKEELGDLMKNTPEKRDSILKILIRDCTTEFQDAIENAEK